MTYHSYRMAYDSLLVVLQGTPYGAAKAKTHKSLTCSLLIIYN